MADNYGSYQPRALEVSDRSWDSIVFMEGIPMGSSDSMLPGLVANEKVASSLRAILPSGWAQFGDTKEVSNLSVARLALPAGTILASKDQTRNSFEIVGPVQAFVNGWVLSVRGTAVVGPNNIITLPSMLSVAENRTDLVFLEVWRELVEDHTVSIHPYGNELAVNTLPNDLVNPLAGTETTQRVQIKYRIRSVAGDLEGNPQGMDTSAAKAQGAKGTAGSMTFFNQASNGDVGLWRAGNGDDSSQAALGTVDGYSYAIPLVAVFRRAQSAGFSNDRQGTTRYLLGDGVHSDRPDGRFLDVIYADDIVDLRHIVSPTGTDITSVAEKTFRQAVSGALRTRRGLVKGPALGGSRIVKGDTLKGIGSTASASFKGAQATGPAALVKRAAFCNAGEVSSACVASFYNGTPWKVDVYQDVRLTDLHDPLLAKEVLGIYFIESTGPVQATGCAAYLSVDGDLVDIEISAGSNLIGKNIPLMLQLGVVTSHGSFGTSDVPERYLGWSDDVTGLLYPARDESLPLPGAPASSLDFVLGAELTGTSTTKLGMEYAFHTALAKDATTLNIPVASGKINGYNVLGIKSVQREETAGVYGACLDFNVTLGASVYMLSGIPASTTALGNVRVSFLLGAKAPTVTRQGRGITGFHETVMVQATLVGGLSYIVDTASEGNKPILALGSRSITLGDSTYGIPFVYVGGEMRSLTTTARYPMHGSSEYGTHSPTCFSFTISGSPTILPVLVPLVLSSYLESADAFGIYYRTAGYQGTSSTVGSLGTVVSECSAISSSSGSGKVTPWVYEQSSDRASFTKHSSTVSFPVNGSGLIGVLPGDLIKKQGQQDDEASVIAAVADASVTLTEAYQGTSAVSSPFVITRKESTTGTECVIDRLPDMGVNGVVAGYMGDSTPLQSNCPTVQVAQRSALQSPLDSKNSDVLVGAVSGAAQGRIGMLLTLQGNDAYYMRFATPAIKYGTVEYAGYKKLYQGYVFNEADTGRLVLAIVASESQNDSGNNALIADRLVDVVDVFELVGRPLVKG